MVPGLVSEMVVPWKSSTVSFASRALRTTSSYAVQKAAKSIASAPLMLGTRSWRVPSGFCMSIARPRLMWAGVIWVGLPSTVSKPTFISGIALSALTRANPIRCVNDTLPPRARDRWLLITIRLSQRSFTGTERTDVAVGTVSEASMLATVRAGAPRSTVYVGWSVTGAGAGAFFSFGTGLSVPLAGSAAALSGRGVARGAERPSGAETPVSPVGAAFSAAGFSGAFSGAASVSPAFAGVGESVAVAVPLAAGAPFPLVLKYAAQLGSTLPGSRWNCSYIPSTSHSLAPKSEDGADEAGSDGLVCWCGTSCFASSGTCARVVWSAV